MNRKYILALISVILFCYSMKSMAQINLRFVDAAEASRLLSTEDAMTDQWSKFDYEARLGRKGGTKQELLDFISQQEQC